MKMLERWDDRGPCKLKNLHVVGGIINGYAEPDAQSWLLRTIVEVYRLGLDSGDLEYAAWGLHNELANSFWAGVWSSTSWLGDHSSPS